MKRRWLWILAGIAALWLLCLSWKVFLCVLGVAVVLLVILSVWAIKQVIGPSPEDDNEEDGEEECWGDEETESLESFKTAV